MANRLSPDGEEEKTMRERLLELILRDAYREGDFTLRSGQKSDYYIDLRVLALEPEAVTLMADLLLDGVLATEARAFGGPTVSSVPILGAMAVRAHQRGLPLTGFFVRDAAKGHGTGKRIEGPALEVGTPVVCLDDICSTGSGARMALEAAEEAGLRVVKVLFVVDREMGGSEQFRAEGYDVAPLFTISEVRAAMRAREGNS